MRTFRRRMVAELFDGESGKVTNESRFQTREFCRFHQRVTGNLSWRGANCRER